MTHPSQLCRPFRTRVISGIACVCLLCAPYRGLTQSPAPPGTAAPVVKQSDKKTEKQKAQGADAYLAGALMLDRRDYPAAEKHFARALSLSPDNYDYITALALAREHRVTDLVQHAGRDRLEGHADQAESLLAQAHLLAPDNAIVAQHFIPASRPSEPWLTEAPVLAGAITLMPASGTKSFHLHGDIQEAVRGVASGYGIRAVFDNSAIHQNLRFDLEDVAYTQAMPLLLRMGKLFAVPLDATSVIVASDTPDNRQRLERQLQETIYIPGMTTEQLSDFGNIVRNIFDVKQATVQNNLGNIIIRAPEQTINAINLTFADLLDGGGEVLLELKLYSVDITHGRNTGVSVPTQIGAYNVASQAQSLVTANQTLVNQAIAQGLIPATASVLQIAEYLIGSGVVTSALLSSTIGIFGGGITTTGVYATGGVTLNFGLTASDTRALDDIQVRVADRQPAEFRLGSRYPITTSTYSTGVTPNSSSLAGININGVSAQSLLSQFSGSGQTIPQIQYEDLGLTLKATPTIMKTGAINMKLDLKIEALAGGALDNIPFLNNRQLVSDVTVNDGETALVVSNVNRSESRAINGIPGLSELPGFQNASDQTVEADTSQLVLLLTPHIVRRRSDILAGPRIAFTPARTAASSSTPTEPPH
jgi:general secretion pathway protein D